MITLRSIKLTNFLSHQATEITFADQDRILIDGKSGSGKSSIVEALTWCLYGKGRVDNRNLVKNGKTQGSVMLKIKDVSKNGVIYYNIERTITNKGKQTIVIAESLDSDKFVPTKVIGMKETQEWIEKKLLKSSYLLFINSVAYPQDNVENFVKQSAVKRKEMLLEIANVEDYDILYEKARLLLSENKVKIGEVEMSISLAKQFIDNNQELLSSEGTLLLEKSFIESSIEIKKQIIQDIRALKMEVVSKESDIKNYSYRKQTIEKAIVSEKNRSESIFQQLATLENYDESLIDGKLVELQMFHDEVKEREALERYNIDCRNEQIALSASMPAYRDYEGEIRTLEEQKERNKPSVFCEEIGRDCPTLAKSSASQASFYDEQITQKRKQLETYKVAMAEYEKKLWMLPQPKDAQGNAFAIEELKRKITKYQVYVTEKQLVKYRETTRDNLNKEREALTTSIKELEAQLTEVEKKQTLSVNELSKIQAQIAEMKVPEIELELTINERKLADIHMKIGRINSIKENVQKYQENIIEKEMVKIELVKEQSILETIKEALSPKGIKTVLIDYLIPRLEEKINEILSQLSDFRISLDTSKSTVNGESVIDGLFINIYNELGENFDFMSYSGGEKLKISVAISEALASLQRAGFRILDEIFMALDNESTSSFSAVIEKLQSNFAQTICITHLQQIKDMFETRVNIIKRGGTSIIE